MSEELEDGRSRVTAGIVYETIKLPEYSDWQCYMFGARSGSGDLIYRPFKGREPHAFARFMMRLCFDCHWVKDAPKTPS